MLGFVILGWAAIAYGIYKNYTAGGDFTRGILEGLQFKGSLGPYSSPAYDFGLVLSYMTMMVGFALLVINTVGLFF